MGLFDDLKKQAEGAVSQLGSNVQQYIKSNVSAAFVKVGEPPKGNLTPAEIAAGQTGEPPPVAPAASFQAAMSSAMPYLPIIAGLVVLALVLKKR